MRGIMKNLRLKSTTVLVIFVAILLTGCPDKGKSEDSAKEKAKSSVKKIEDYFPLVVGTTWIYKDSDDKQGAFSIVEKTNKNNISIYQAKSAGTVFFKDCEIAIINGELTKKHSDGGIFIQLKEPLTVGTKWYPYPKILPKVTYEIISTTDEIALPLGTYKDVIKIESKINEDLVGYLYFAKGVGLVKIKDPKENKDVVILIKYGTGILDTSDTSELKQKTDNVKKTESSKDEESYCLKDAKKQADDLRETSAFVRNHYSSPKNTVYEMNEYVDAEFRLSRLIKNAKALSARCPEASKDLDYPIRDAEATMQDLRKRALRDNKIELEKIQRESRENFYKSLYNRGNNQD